jgi:hypothetical protein
LPLHRPRRLQTDRDEPIDVGEVGDASDIHRSLGI